MRCRFNKEKNDFISSGDVNYRKRGSILLSLKSSEHGKKYERKEYKIKSSGVYDTDGDLMDP